MRRVWQDIAPSGVPGADPDLSANSGQTSAKTRPPQGGLCHVKGSSAPLWICHICPTFRPACKGHGAQIASGSPSSDRPKTRARSGLPMWIASRSATYWDRERPCATASARSASLTSRGGRIVWARRSPLCGAGMRQSHHQSNDSESRHAEAH